MSGTRKRLFGVLAAVGMLTLGGPATTLAADAEEGIGGALLVIADMPEGLLPQGIEDATEFDIDTPSYEANGGLEKANQKWGRNGLDGTEKVAVLIDFRMLFADVAAAQAYLDAAEEILSESVTGLTLQPDTPTVGDDVRHYAGTLQGDGFTAEAQNFLFREGPVVAKVYLLGFGTTLEDALPIAQAAADRTATWIADRPLASPGASPDASAATSPEPSIAGVTPEPSIADVTPEPSVAVESPGPATSGQPSSSAAPAGTELRQWAVGATASSEYTSTSFSALEATGPPDVGAYLDDGSAWAPYNSDGSEEWLELTYAQAVVPSAVGIVETYGNGAVITVEAFDETSDAWVELWSGDDPSPAEVTTFSPPLDAVTFATDRIRISFGDIVPGWSEIDAVELVGIVP